MRVHIYARVSTPNQAEEGYSIPTQLEACREKAEEIGATEIVEHVEPGFSGFEFDRPVFARLREAVYSKKVDVIICYDPDRLFRNQLHQGLFVEDVRKAGVKIVFITVQYEDSPEGQLMFGIRGAVSEYERAKIRERTIRGKKGKAQAGKIVMNTHPFGYDFDPVNSMYIENGDSDLVRKIFRWAISGTSITQITRRLNQNKVPSPKDGVWHVGTISRILHNPMYAGEAIQFREKREKINGKWVTTERNPSDWITVACPPLVTREEFDAVQQVIAQNQRFSPRNTQRVYMLQYIARCGICGRQMMITQRGRKVYYYLCTSHRLAADTGETHCGSRGVRADLLDDFVWDKLKALTTKPTKVRQLIAQKKLLAKSAKTLEILRQRETELLTRQKALVSQFSRGRIEHKIMDETLDIIKRDLDDVRKRIADLGKLSNLRNVDDRVAGFMTAIQNIENRREACLQALEAVYITRTDNNVGRYADTKVDVKIVPK